jgi:hypothetical protein
MVLYLSGAPSESTEPPVGGVAHCIPVPPIDPSFDPAAENVGVCGDVPATPHDD